MSSLSQVVTLLLCLPKLTDSFSLFPKATSKPAPSVPAPFSQVLEFVEPQTGVTVQLIGAMHYNPASIRLAADTVTQLDDSGRLGSVLIESCDQRWNTSTTPNIISGLLTNEMRAAHDVALERGVPVVLADQRINITTSRMGDAFKDTAQDLVTLQWKNIWENLVEARKQAVPFGKAYLGPTAVLDPKFLLAAPVSFLKYPLSYFVRAPISTAIFLGFLWSSDANAAATAMDWNQEVPLTDSLLSLAGSVLETVFFGRVFLKELLVERNEVLARNILEQCRYYKDTWLPLPVVADNAVYVENSPLPKRSSDKVVVAVLGMAHCNGIRKLLEEELV